MVTKVYSSVDYSRLGIQSISFKTIYDELKYKEARRRLRIFRVGGGYWSYEYTPSEHYKARIAELSKRVEKRFLEESMAHRIYRKKREEEDSENRCAVLAARMFKVQHGAKPIIK